MTFSHSEGTHGATLPARALRWVNKVVTPGVRRRSKPLAGMNLLVLTTVGRSSGREHTTPVAWFGDDDGWLVVASAGGAATNPDWYRNLAAHPDRATVELDGRKIPVVRLAPRS